MTFVNIEVTSSRRCSFVGLMSTKINTADSITWLGKPLVVAYTSIKYTFHVDLAQLFQSKFLFSLDYTHFVL